VVPQRENRLLGKEEAFAGIKADLKAFKNAIVREPEAINSRERRKTPSAGTKGNKRVTTSSQDRSTGRGSNDIKATRRKTG